MKVSGFTSATGSPAIIPSPTRAPCRVVLRAIPWRCERRSATMNPTLCRVPAYSGPGLPRPTTRWRTGVLGRRNIATSAFPVPGPGGRPSPLSPSGGSGRWPAHRRHVLGYDGVGGHERAVAHRDRRHQRGVGADEALLADDRAVLLPAVILPPAIVARDRAGTDVCVLPHGRIAQIGEMAGRHPVLQHGVLQFNKVADLHLPAQPASGAEVGERPDPAPFAHP